MRKGKKHINIKNIKKKYWILQRLLSIKSNSFNYDSR